MKSMSSFNKFFTVGKVAALALIAGHSAFLMAAAGAENTSSVIEQSSQGLSFLLDPNGNITLRNAKGENIGEKCAVNLNSDEACSIFQPQNQILVNTFTNLVIVPRAESLESSSASASKSNTTAVQYAGSPQCVVLSRGGVFYQYCKP